MIANRNTRARVTSAAVLVRIAAFLTTLVGSIVIAWSFATVALRHAPFEHAALVAAIAILVVAGAIFTARATDPLRR